MALLAMDIIGNKLRQLNSGEITHLDTQFIGLREETKNEILVAFDQLDSIETNRSTFVKVSPKDIDRTFIIKSNPGSKYIRYVIEYESRLMCVNYSFIDRDALIRIIDRISA